MRQNQFRKVAVLGAGVMGAQIAAHLANARVPVILFDLPAKDGQTPAARNGVVTKALEGLKKLSPAPLGVAELAANIEAANYEDHIAKLGECDLVIEAIAERLDWKKALYERIAPHVAAHATLATNTSGLSIESLSQALPEALRPRFCGVHFFNPPRYMHLVELIPTAATEPARLDALEAFLVTTQGKGVIRAKDTPNFIANRVGVFGILATIIEAEKRGLTYDVVDDLTGAKMGRAKSGTFRTADVVGLDTMAHVIKTMQDMLTPEQDSFAAHFATPKVLSALIEKGALGQKTKAGFYTKRGATVMRLDPAKADYVPSGAKADETVARILKKAPAERLKLLRESTNPQAQFVWAILRDVFHYIAVHLGSIAESARDVDLALRWGFGWSEGPFELWQQAGWSEVAAWIGEDIASGAALSSQPLPGWVTEGAVAAAGGVHTEKGSWSVSKAAFVQPASLAVYERQAVRETVFGASSATVKTLGTTVFEDESVRAWHQNDDVLVLTYKTKMRTISSGVLQGIHRAIAEAEQNYSGLVIWQGSDPFSVGADLQAMLPAYMAGGSKAIEGAVKAFQDAMMAIKYAQIPVVAAAQGLALGGGCETLLHCAHRVVALETYVGLVEVGVGLVPAGGGLKETALRCAEVAQGGRVFDVLKDRYTTIAMGQVAKSAMEARKMGFLRETDTIVMNAHELLHVAKAQGRAMAEAGYRPPVAPKAIPVVGRSGIATIGAQLINMRDGGFISAYDFKIGMMIADVLCGGDVDANSVVDEAWLLAAERKAFCALVDQPKTHERIMGMLNTGKPVRN